MKVGGAYSCQVTNPAPSGYSWQDMWFLQVAIVLDKSLEIINRA